MRSFLSSNRYAIGFAILGAIVFVPFLGSVHLFDWDEVNFAEIAREMIVTGEYSRVYVDFKPFWQKPPLFFWLQVICMKIFGIGEFAARLPNAICGIITLPIIYRIGKKIHSHQFGLVWTLVYFGAILPSFYFQSGIIDPVFNLFIFLGMYFFILGNWKQFRFSSIDLSRPATWYYFIGGLFTAAAILTKGPVAFLILALCVGVYYIWNRFRQVIAFKHALIFVLATCSFTLMWYGLETWLNGPWFVTEFIKYNYQLFSTEDAGHGGFFGYHFVVVFLGCFPATPFLIKAFKKVNDESNHFLDFKSWMIILLWTILILFSVVQSKIVHYSSMAYFPVTFLAAWVIHRLNQKKESWSTWFSGLLISVSLIIGAAIAIMPWLSRNLDRLKPYVADPFAKGNMEAQVHWTGWESLIGVLLLAVTTYGIMQYKRQHIMIGTILLFVGTTITMKIANVVLTPKIEGYSQRVAIEFYQEHEGEDVYMATAFKSYAHYFYFKQPNGGNENRHDRNWLMHGDIDKPVYFVSKINHTYLDEQPHIELLYQKNGFKFYKREMDN